jgi:hypothetical protein
MKFDMSAAWRDATAMIAGNREVLLIVGGLFFFLPSVALTFSMGEMEEMMLADPEAASAAMLSLYADWGWLIFLVSLASIVGYLALLALLRDHSRPTVGEALKTALIGLLPALGASILAYLGMGLVGGLLIGIAIAAGSPALAFVAGAIVFVGVVYVGVKLSLSGPVVAIDKVFNPIRILTRSWGLTKGNSFRLLLFYLLLIIVYFVLAIVLDVVIGGLTLAVGPDTGLIVNAVLNGLLSAAFTVVFVAVLAAAHRQLSGPSAEAVSATFE